VVRIEEWLMKIVTICGEAKKIRKRRMESNDQIMKIEELKQLKGGTSPAS